MLYDIDESGYLNFDDTVQDTTLLGVKSRNIQISNSIVYADDDLLTYFFCYETEYLGFTFARRKFTIVAKQRGFDSLSQLSKAIEPLERLGIDNNEIFFDYNGPNCKN
jgi:hypothetical protein